MATKHDVIRLHAAHPHWTARDIADELGCMPEYVNATARRNGLSLPKAIRPAGTGVTALGSACRRLGLTMADLEAIAAKESDHA